MPLPSHFYYFSLCSVSLRVNQTGCLMNIDELSMKLIEKSTGCCRLMYKSFCCRLQSQGNSSISPFRIIALPMFVEFWTPILSSPLWHWRFVGNLTLLVMKQAWLLIRRWHWLSLIEACALDDQDDPVSRCHWILCQGVGHRCTQRTCTQYKSCILVLQTKHSSLWCLFYFSERQTMVLWSCHIWMTAIDSTMWIMTV